MKTVFTKRELPHIWATQKQEEGRTPTRNFYFERDTIYSYGPHFPIARIIGNDVLFTLRNYSSTTSAHIWLVKSAISHKNLIYCYYVPTFSGSTYEHEKNLNEWKNKIKSLFNELGNKRNRDIQGRVNGINYHIELLTTYCNYFKLKIKDNELKKLLKLAKSDSFVESARIAREKQEAANDKKMQKAKEAFDIYINLWREGNDNAIRDLHENTKQLIIHYKQSAEAYTRLRYNSIENRVETSKGVQIPVEIAKRAFTALNGCMANPCNTLSIPVMGYTITKTTKDALIAGCHTIPKQDVTYIANLLGW